LPESNFMDWHLVSWNVAARFRGRQTQTSAADERGSSPDLAATLVILSI
jgi:hypothetical protein